MAKKFNSGRFIPQNPAKYLGDPRKIFYRSSWEMHCMKWFDSTNAVLRWGSEEFSINYVSPLDGRVHKYYPDMVMIYRDVTGQIKKEIIEIKPYNQSVLTPKMSEQDKKVLIVNQAKWQAAEVWASANGATMRILTEKSIFANKSKKAIGTAV